MEALAAAFPLLVFVATAALVIFVIRLDRRLSRGARSAGPREVVRPAPVGLQRTPWELKALNDQLRMSSNHRARSDLVQTINRLSRAAGLQEPRFFLTPDASDAMIAAVVDHLERLLELPPLPPMPGTHRLGSTDR